MAVDASMAVDVERGLDCELAACKTLECDEKRGREMGACESLRLSNCVLVQPDGWARGEREGYGGRDPAT